MSPLKWGLRGAVLALSLFAVACASSTEATLDVIEQSKTRPPVPPEKVAIYHKADQVPGKYEELALIKTSGSPLFSSDDDLFQMMRQTAGELGANAVIVDAMSEPDDSSLLMFRLIGSAAMVERQGQAIAIYVHPKNIYVHPKKKHGSATNAR